MAQPNQYGTPMYPVQPQFQAPAFPPQIAAGMPQQQFYYPQQPGLAPQSFGQDLQFYPQQPMMIQQQPMMVQQQPIMVPQQPMLIQQQPVIMQQPMMQQKPVHVIHQGAVGAHPQVLQCPNCHEIVTSKVESKATAATHMTACIICCISSFCFCCCLAAIPYCMDSFKCQTHRCPRCNTYLGKFDETSKKACLGTGALALCCALCGGGDSHRERSDSDEERMRMENGEIEGENKEFAENQEAIPDGELEEKVDEPEEEIEEKADEPEEPEEEPEEEPSAEEE